MTVDNDAFATMTNKDYTWPVTKPITSRPTQPPKRTKPNNLYVSTLVEPYCHCDAHLYDPQMARYSRLARKENLLYEELEDVSIQMTLLSGQLLDHPCDRDDTKMETIYQIDYTKRGFNPVHYRKLEADLDSPVGIPVGTESIGILKGYRDPHIFKYHTFAKPTTLDVCDGVLFTRTPTSIDEWYVPITGSTEYKDTISKTGIDIMKNRQQFTEPLPSSRRRQGSPCL